jgi:hypothetical protein
LPRTFGTSLMSRRCRSSGSKVKITTGTK